VAGAVSSIIRVAIVDDHPVVREGTASIVARQEDMEVVASTASVQELTGSQTDVDVVLLDLRLGTELGFSLLQDASLRAAVVVLTAYDYPQYVEAALRLGAAGYVLKTAPIAELLDAIRRAAAGGMAFGVRASRTATRLSDREREVVAAVVDGLSNDEAASRLGISPRTVESHLRRIFERYALASRAELAARAVREGWLEVPSG
jgi:DNA-binding NarL/FixJ family response regulator